MILATETITGELTTGRHAVTLHHAVLEMIEDYFVITVDNVCLGCFDIETAMQKFANLLAS